MVKGIHFDQTFSPTARHESLKLFLVRALKNKQFVGSFDVKSAYLNASITEELYMHVPKGIQTDGDQIIRLLKAMPGLKQSGREWNKEVDAKLRSFGWIPLKSEPCIYMRGEESLLLYTDDALVATASKASYAKIVDEIRSAYELVDNGELTHFLGMRFKCFTDRIVIDQEVYAMNILQKFNMTDCNSASTPAGDESNKPPSPEVLLDSAQATLYRSGVGGLLYLMLMTRPDLAFACGRLSRKMAMPTEHDFAALKRCLRYVKGTTKLKFTLTKPDSSTDLLAYSDSDFAGFKTNKRSTSGFAVYYGTNLISSKSRMQRLVATSTCEAELLAVTLSIKEVVYISNLITELGMPKSPTTVVHCDNQPAIALSNNPSHHSRSKHFSLRSHWVREHVDSKLVRLKYIDTNINISDTFTKPLSRGKFITFRKLLLNQN